MDEQLQKVVRIMAPWEKVKANLVIISVIMAVAGQKNHYNVELLKGYGVSINLKDNRAEMRGLMVKSQRQLYLIWNFRLN